MSRIGVDVSELRQVGADLEKNGGGVGAKSATALKKTAYDIEAGGKARARVDTGAMKNSISTTITGDGRFSEITAEIGPTVDYGLWQEIGTSVMAGQAFMGPAFDQYYPPFEQAIAQIGGQIL